MLSSFHAPFAIVQYRYTEKEKERIVFFQPRFDRYGFLEIINGMKSTAQSGAVFVVGLFFKIP